jgi:hypothetical protein
MSNSGEIGSQKEILRFAQDDMKIRWLWGAEVAIQMMNQYTLSGNRVDASSI